MTDPQKIQFYKIKNKATVTNSSYWSYVFPFPKAHFIILWALELNILLTLLKILQCKEIESIYHDAIENNNNKYENKTKYIQNKDKSLNTYQLNAFLLRTYSVETPLYYTLGSS